MLEYNSPVVIAGFALSAVLTVIGVLLSAAAY